MDGATYKIMRKSLEESYCLVLAAAALGGGDLAERKKIHDDYQASITALDAEYNEEIK